MKQTPEKCNFYANSVVYWDLKMSRLKRNVIFIPYKPSLLTVSTFMAPVHLSFLHD